MTLPRLSPLPRRALQRVSAFDLSWDARWLLLDALTGQAGVGTFLSANNLVGSDGVTLAALDGQPRWQMLDLEAGITGRESASLLFGSSDSLVWDHPIGTDEATLLLRFVQPASFPANGTGLLYVGNSAVSDGRWFLDSTGSQYRLTYHNGTSSVTSTMSGTAPTSGQVVVLRGHRDASGRVQLHQSIDDGAETSASQSGTLTPAAFGSVTQAQLNGIGGANRTSFAALKAIVTSGLWSRDSLLNRY